MKEKVECRECMYFFETDRIRGKHGLIVTGQCRIRSVEKFPHRSGEQWCGEGVKKS